MFSNTDQYSSSSIAFFDSQLDAFSALSRKALQGTEKAAALNIGAFKSSASDSTIAAKNLVAAKDQHDYLSLATEYVKPNADKIVAYGRDLADIMTTMALLPIPRQQQFLQRPKQVR